MSDHLGPYRLGFNEDPECGIYTGDCRELAKAIPDESVDLIFTDPVYDRIDDYRWLAAAAVRVLKPRGVLLAFIGINYAEDVLLAMRGDLRYRGMLAWNLKGPANKRYGKTIDNGAWCLWYGGWPQNYTPLVWDSLTTADTNRLSFRWQKSPVLVGRHIADFAPERGIVADFFAGSGTMPACCKQMRRRYLAFEIDTRTAQSARRRLHQTQPPLFVVDAPEQVRMTI